MCVSMHDRGRYRLTNAILWWRGEHGLTPWRLMASCVCRRRISLCIRRALFDSVFIHVYVRSHFTLVSFLLCAAARRLWGKAELPFKKRTAHSSTVSLTEFLKFAFWTLLWCLVFLELSLHLPFEAHKSRPAIEAGFDSNWVFIKTLKCIEIKWACVTALSKNEQMVLMNRLNHAPLGLLCRCCINLATFLNSYGTRSPRLAFVQPLSPHFAKV